MSRLKPFKSKRQTLMDNRAQINFYASAADKTPDFAIPLPAERKPRAPSDAISEADVMHACRRWLEKQPMIELYRNSRGSVILDNGGRLTYGLGPNGASDLIGYRTLTITPDMVGRTIAQFVAIEAKRPGAEARDDQAEFLARIDKAGGVAGVAHSAEELQAIIQGA